MKWYMKNIHVFKNYFTQSNKPHTFRDYINSLSDEKLIQFYNQMKEPVSFVKDLDYLLYKLRWIIDSDSDDLSRDLFIQSVMSCEEHLIEDKWVSILYKRYEKDIQELLDNLSS